MSATLQYSNIKGCHRLVIPESRGFMIIDTSDILYVESDINYSRFYFRNGEKTYLSSKTLKEYSGLLIPVGFFRIHQSYLINLSYIKEFRINGSELELVNGFTLPVARQKKQGFKELLLSKDSVQVKIHNEGSKQVL